MSAVGKLLLGLQQEIDEASRAYALIKAECDAKVESASARVNAAVSAYNIALAREKVRANVLPGFMWDLYGDLGLKPEPECKKPVQTEPALAAPPTAKAKRR